MNISKRLPLLLVALAALTTTALGDPGAAIVIVYDTSGSMVETVKSASGPKKKYVIASETLEKIVGKIDAFQKGGHKVQAGIIRFPDTGKSMAAVPFGDWNPQPFLQWLKAFNSPKGGTPLGNAILTASKLVADSPLDKKHVVILTDGLNNSGISNEDGVRQGQEYAKKKGAAGVNYYFIAFDTAASQFSAVKKNGAVVLSASDEGQLQKGMTSIFAEKILLEDE